MYSLLRFVSERADSSETLMAVRIPEKPGIVYYNIFIIHVHITQHILHIEHVVYLVNVLYACAYVSCVIHICIH